MSASPVEQAIVGGVSATAGQRRRFDPARSGPYFAGLLLVALVAFWPSYLSQFGAQTSWTHLHAFLATLWLLLLIAQPLLIRSRRMTWHRTFGRISYGLALTVTASVILLAHSRISGVTATDLPRRSYVLYLQVSLVLLFTFVYAMAVMTRHDAPLHARFMICTGLTFIDPVMIRLLLWLNPEPGWNYQWLTFATTDLLLLIMIVLERRQRRGRWVFPSMLALFVASQLPALCGWTAAAWWQGFARWFAALPLT